VRTAEKWDESEGRLNCSVVLEFDRSLWIKRIEFLIQMTMEVEINILKTANENVI